MFEAAEMFLIAQDKSELAMICVQSCFAVPQLASGLAPSSLNLPDLEQDCMGRLSWQVAVDYSTSRLHLDSPWQLFS